LPEGIVAEVLVVVEVFAAGGEGEDPLSEQPALGVGDEAGVAGIGNGVVESVDQSELFISLAEDQNAGVGGDLTAREIGMNDASSRHSHPLKLREISGLAHGSDSKFKPDDRQPVEKVGQAACLSLNSRCFDRLEVYPTAFSMGC
jgi:hypothetical protein